jgi:sugar lactone lactonase YvrE
MQTLQIPCVRLAAVSVLSLGSMIGPHAADRSSKGDPPAGIRSLTPYSIVASGFERISAVAVDGHGAILVTDVAEGTLTRIDASGNRRLLLARLHRPLGVAVDGGRGVLVLDEGGRRVVRLSADGSLSVVTSALEQARSIAAGPDGRVWISTRRERSDREDGDQPGTARASEYVVACLEPSGALITLASGFVNVQGLAADASGVYVAMGRLAAERGRLRTTLARVPVRVDGSAGAIEPILRNTPLRTQGVAVDAVGDVFVSGTANLEAGSAGMIVKRRRSGEASALAAGLDDPVAVAFAPNGDLIAADRRLGRVLRLRATPAPEVVAPPFTNQMPLEVSGRSIARALVQVFRAPDLTVPLATTTAETMGGGFTLQAPLAPNTETPLAVLATAAGGAGLVSTPRTLLVVHDDRIPTVAMAEPPAGIHARDLVALRARAEDEGSGLASMAFTLDETVAATVENPEPGRPLVAHATLDTRQVAEGPHALTVVATDRAANSASAAQLIVVDRTPPDTLVLTGPPHETAEGTAIFTFTGADVQSADLDFAWRIDEGAWSAFTASRAVEFTSLAAGAHRFEVKTRDRAGNEDPTPAAHTFTVTALRIRILEPAPGAVITTETTWVRGTVESGGRDVAVSIPLPPEFRSDLSLEELPAVTEAGTFAAEVPVTPGMTAVTVIARDGQGATSTDSVNVVVQGALSGSLRLEAFPAAGLAPHTARFSPDAFPSGSVYSLDLESDGTIDYEGDTLSDREFVYARPGAYVARLQATTPDGRMLTARTSVDVYDRATLDAKLQAVWRDFKDALRRGDVTRAASFVHRDRRAVWEEYFRQFTPNLFALTDTVFLDVTLLDIAPGRAECETMREVDGLLYSFPVSFLIDADGGWRLWQF